MTGRMSARQPTISALEVEDYLDAAEKLGHLAMFTLAACGKGELIALLWSDLDVEQEKLAIQEERVVKSGKPVVYGKRKRVVLLAHQTVKLLEAEHQKHPSNPWMFPHPGTGKPYSRTMIRNLHSKILEKAGIDHIRLEDLRHTFAIQSLQGGMKAKELSVILGHTRPDFLARSYRPYLLKKEIVGVVKKEHKPSWEEMKKAAEKIGFKNLMPS